MQGNLVPKREYDPYTVIWCVTINGKKFHVKHTYSFGGPKGVVTVRQCDGTCLEDVPDQVWKEAIRLNPSLAT